MVPRPRQSQIPIDSGDQDLDPRERPCHASGSTTSPLRRRFWVFLGKTRWIGPSPLEQALFYFRTFLSCIFCAPCPWILPRFWSPPRDDPDWMGDRPFPALTQESPLQFFRFGCICRGKSLFEEPSHKEKGFIPVEQEKPRRC